MNHYEVLGVPRTADTATIRRAYKALAKTTHPDYGGDPEVFAAVCLAWAVLRDPRTRAAHDAELRGDQETWGVEVNLDEPIPSPRATAAADVPEPDPSAPDPVEESADAAADAEHHVAPDRDTRVDPFASPPRTLPQPDTAHIARSYPREVGAWAFYGYAATVLVVIALTIALPWRLPFSPAVLAVGLMPFSLVLVLGLALRSWSVGANVIARFISALWLYGAIAFFAFIGGAWAADSEAPATAHGPRWALILSTLAVAITLAVICEVRSSRRRGSVRAIKRVYDAAAAAHRWNALLAVLTATPTAVLRRARVIAPGFRTPVPGWAVLDTASGKVQAVATDDDRVAWCRTLRRAGLDIDDTTVPAHHDPRQRTPA